MKRQVSTRQLEMLLQFMEQERHKSLALGRVRGKEGNALSTKLWAKCAAILNAASVPGGVRKPAEQWKKYYNQYKSRTRAKQQIILKELSKPGGKSGIICLTPLEERLIRIIGVGPMRERNSSQDELDIEVVGDSDCDEDDKEYITTPKMPKKESIEAISDANPSDNDSDTEDTLFIKRRKSSQYSTETSKPPRSQRSSTPEVNNEFELAGQRIAAIEESRMQVDREMTQAIHRLASSIEQVAEAITTFCTSYYQQPST